MNLWDARLGFARHLIRHWSGIARRANELVPDERYLDPETLLKVHSRMIIADISDPQVAAIQVLGSAVRSRYPDGTQRGDDWLSFIPSAYLELAYTALDKLIGTPCGVYYHFRLLDRENRAETGNVLVLPLMSHKSQDKPSMFVSVSQTDDDEIAHVPLKTMDGEVAYVDIGAGT
jgi:hypothetical protein